MMGRSQSTRANIAVLLPAILLSFAVLSSFKRHIHFSGPPQTISTKYVSAGSAVHYFQHIALSSGIRLHPPQTKCLYLIAVSEEDRQETRFDSFLYDRPPPIV